MSQRYITVREARQYLKDRHYIEVSKRTVREWVSRGRVWGAYTLLGRAGLWVTTESDIDKAVTSGHIPPKRGNPNWGNDG